MKLNKEGGKDREKLVFQEQVKKVNATSAIIFAIYIHTYLLIDFIAG